MDRITSDRCLSAGFERYEISNYSRSGHQCRHNLVYWQNEEYMACGAGAVSFCGGVRAKNTGNPEAYCAAVEAGLELCLESEKLDEKESFRETVMLGLRLIKGVSTKRLYRRFGWDLKAEYGTVLDDMDRPGSSGIGFGASKIIGNGPAAGKPGNGRTDFSLDISCSPLFFPSWICCCRMVAAAFNLVEIEGCMNGQQGKEKGDEKHVENRDHADSGWKETEPER